MHNGKFSKSIRLVPVLVLEHLVGFSFTHGSGRKDRDTVYPRGCGDYFTAHEHCTMDLSSEDLRNFSEGIGGGSKSKLYIFFSKTKFF